MATATPRQQPQRRMSAHGTPCSLEETIRASSYFAWKGALDWVLAAFLLVPGIPLMLAVWLVVRLSSSGPALFRQVRVGRNGKNFVMVKFRTMVHNAEAVTGAIWASPNDPRLTRIGALLRKIHLDELPQIWNVLRGDMSLVGPRPERPEFVTVLSAQILGYSDRLKVAPGITGLAQVNLPPDSDLDSVRRKLVLDVEYIRNGGVLLDLRLIVYSCMRMFGVPGSILMRTLGLLRHVSLADANSPQSEPAGAPGRPEWTSAFNRRESEAVAGP